MPLRRLALVAVLALLVVPAAHADADPASDILYTQRIYLPFFGEKVSKPNAAALKKVVDEAWSKGYKVKVALIATRNDLGGVFQLWEKPQTYADFLGRELIFLYKGPLITAMPNGLGVYHYKHSTSAEEAVVAEDQGRSVRGRGSERGHARRRQARRDQAAAASERRERGRRQRRHARVGADRDRRRRGRDPGGDADSGAARVAQADGMMPFPYPPTPIGTGPKFHPPAQTRPVPLSCAKTKRYGVHLELFARNRVIIVPAGIEHRCLRTRWPVGIVEVRGRHTLGEFFRVWRQPLSQTRLVGFKTRPDRPVRAYVNGRRWRGELRRIPLRRHANIVLELGRYIPPKKVFLFPLGL